MIKIQMTVDQFNKINKFGKKYNGKKSSGRNLQYTRLKIKGDKLTAEGLDGYKLFKVDMEVENLSNKDGTIYIETMNNFKKAGKIVRITEEDEEVRIEALHDNDIRVINKVDYKFFNTEGIMLDDKPEFTISFDPKKLKEALEAYNDKVVTLEFFGELKQVQISNRLDTESMVLPIRLGK